jgi:hypothetical protein
MWAVVSFFNLCFSPILICIIPLAEVGAYQPTSLSGQTTGGNWLGHLIFGRRGFGFCVVPFLTSFVGVSGLLNRMDRICLIIFETKQEWF